MVCNDYLVSEFVSYLFLEEFMKINSWENWELRRNQSSKLGYAKNQEEDWRRSSVWVNNKAFVLWKKRLAHNPFKIGTHVFEYLCHEVAWIYS